MLYKQPRPAEVLTAHGRPTQDALPRRFTVCIWNWQKCKQKSWTEDFQKISAAADLFLAQEVHRTDKVQTVMDAAPYYWTGAVSFFSLKDNSPIGVATGYTKNHTKDEQLVLADFLRSGELCAKLIETYAARCGSK